MTEGKEAALQPGFDEGFARVGGPIGRRLGSLRGCAAGLISILSSEHIEHVYPVVDGRDLKQEATEISRELNDVRFSDLAASSEVELPENILEELKNASSIDESQSTSKAGDAAYDKLRTLETRLEGLCLELGFTFRL